MRFYRSITILALAVVCLSAAAASAQTKRRTKAPAKKAIVATPAATTDAQPAEPVVVKTEPKKNERPTAGEGGPGKGTNGPVKTANDPTYFYEFSQRDFLISKIVIEHDEAGSGKITFTKKMFGDMVTDPLQVSPAVMDRINVAYAALNFLDSTESYQYEKDYSHLGVMTFRLKKGERQRSSVFNYTTNKDAKVLADEYRKLGNQFVWMFDISVARENQPLEAPKLLDALDGMLKRNEISDPAQMLTLLKGMMDDERIPLIARNHAGKLVERIEKGRRRR